jgi:predicted phosphodiesterase
VTAPLTRIFSDVHFGDRASRVRELGQLRPLLDGVTHLVLNGDTLDTRPGGDPAETAELGRAVRSFFAGQVPAVTFVTGNHDADFSPHHHVDLADGAVFATHGDILFDNLVPWSRDARVAGQRIAVELTRLADAERADLDRRLAAFRRVAHSIPQRHQAEKNPLRYAVRFLADTVWPPHRVILIARAWQLLPPRTFELVRRHRPQARFVLTGHIHRPGVWTSPRGVVSINTGSFVPPLGGYAVDLTPAALAVRRVELRRGEFHPGERVAEFPLAAGGGFADTTP